MFYSFLQKQSYHTFFITRKPFLKNSMLLPFGSFLWRSLSSTFIFFLEKLFESFPLFFGGQNPFRIHSNGETFDVTTLLTNLLSLWKDDTFVVLCEKKIFKRTEINFDFFQVCSKNNFLLKPRRKYCFALQ